MKKIKEKFPNIDVVAGSIATGEGAEALIKAGADGIRCGIGNGSICITRYILIQLTNNLYILYTKN